MFGLFVIFPLWVFCYSFFEPVIFALKIFFKNIKATQDSNKNTPVDVSAWNIPCVLVLS